MRVNETIHSSHSPEELFEKLREALDSDRSRPPKGESKILEHYFGSVTPPNFFVTNQIVMFNQRYNGDGLALVSGSITPVADGGSRIHLVYSTQIAKKSYLFALAIVVALAVALLAADYAIWSATGFSLFVRSPQISEFTYDWMRVWLMGFVVSAIVFCCFLTIVKQHKTHVSLLKAWIEGVLER